MAPENQKLLIAVVAVVVIALSALRLIGGCGGEPGGAIEPPAITWRCSACSHEFDAPITDAMMDAAAEPGLGMAELAERPCPKCGKPAHARLTCVCGACGTAFTYTQELVKETDARTPKAHAVEIPVRCVNPACSEPRVRRVWTRPAGEWRKAECSACGRAFEAMVSEGKGTQPQCYYANCRHGRGQGK